MSRTFCGNAAAERLTRNHRLDAYPGVKITGIEVENRPAHLLGGNVRATAQGYVKIGKNHLSRGPQIATQTNDSKGRGRDNIAAGILASGAEVRDRCCYIDRRGDKARWRIEQGDVAGSRGNSSDRAITAHCVNATTILRSDVAGVPAGAEKDHGSKGGKAELHLGQVLTWAKSTERVHRKALLWLQAKPYVPVRMLNRPPLRILIAAPRGFCAGVDRAIQIVELALKRFGAPIYVRHEIVHNRFVVERLRGLGAIFVDELDEVPDDRPVVFSAHGVPKSVPAEAQSRSLTYVDATCPLVSKVHRQAERLIEEGRHILFIGHAGHPEVIGTFGQVLDGAITLIETVDDAERVAVPGETNFRLSTQTTLSVDDTAAIVDALKRRFPDIRAPRSEDICYATSNRQAAVKAIAKECERMLVIGAPNSSNSLRLAEVADRMGVSARLIERSADIDWEWLGEPQTVGLTAGASAPEVLVREVIDALAERFDVTEEIADHSPERMIFKLPRELVD